MGVSLHGRIEEFAEGNGVSPEPPLVVDLDGTLVRTDLLAESVLALLRAHAWYIFLLPIWLARGKAWFKRQVEQRALPETATLPWNTELIEYLARQRSQGRSLVLATASDSLVARQVADHLKLFDAVFASDGVNNLAGGSKRDLLVARFGEHGYDYAADGAGARHCDLAVWASARQAILVNPGESVKLAAARVASVGKIFARKEVPLAGRVSALRPAHWLKNLLVLAPVFAAHRYGEAALLGKSLAAYLAFGCCASAGYLFNDLIDLEADRHHPQKRFRALASGDLPLSFPLAMIPALLIVSCSIGIAVSRALFAILALYFAMSAAYTLHMKKVAVLDVLFLAGLYAVRILAGSAATGIWPSHWLLAFSTFLFFSLALVKRYAELVIMRRADGDGAKARAYELSDGELLASMGTSSGYLAVLVLALYIATDKAQTLYATRELLWLLCPLLLYWVSYLWLTAHRGRMPGDPVVFATGDRTSRILLFLMLATAAAAL